MGKSLVMLLVLVFLMASCLVIAEPASSSDEIRENTWAAKEPLPQEPGGVEAAVVNGKIYVIGSSFNCEYDTATNTWAAKNPMPTPRIQFGIAVYQNRIYAIGG